MRDLHSRDRAELLDITGKLTLERKAEIIFLHCVHGKDIVGNDSWYIDEIAQLYGIKPDNGIYRNCYPATYSFREVYNLMYTYPEGLEDGELRFEDIILDINPNRALRYYGKGMGMDKQPPMDSKYNKYDNYGEEADIAVKNIYDDKKPVIKRYSGGSNMMKLTDNTDYELLKLVVCGLLEAAMLAAIIFVKVNYVWLVVRFNLGEFVHMMIEPVSIACSFLALLAGVIFLLLLLMKKYRQVIFSMLFFLGLTYAVILTIQCKFLIATISFGVTIYLNRLRKKYE